MIGHDPAATHDVSPWRIALAAMLLGAMSIGNARATDARPAHYRVIGNATGWNPVLAAGVPAGKLVIGAAFHARVSGGVGPTHDGLYQPYKNSRAKSPGRN